MNQSVHIPVLLNETITGLNIKANGIYVDCTMGGAGHASEILKRLSPEGKLYCLDQDEYAIQIADKRLKEISNNYKIIKTNFSMIKEKIASEGVTKVDGILYDLGVSSFQLDIASRGFSYSQDATLDMRMDTEQYLKAYDVVNFYTYDELKKIFYVFGEEKFAPIIAKKIVQVRETKPIETTLELVEIVKECLPARVKRQSKHPAKKVFQALRIAVNDELEVFDQSLRNSLDLLAVGGRIAVITFHSLEDRICKQIFKECVEVHVPKGLAIKDKDVQACFKLVNKKVIVPTKEEIETNRRAHSAKLRIIEKIKEGEENYGKFQTTTKTSKTYKVGSFMF